MADEVPRVKGFKDFMRRSGWAMLALLFVVTGLGAGVYAFWQGTHNQDQNQNQQQLKGQKYPGFKSPGKIDELRTKDSKIGSGKTADLGDSVTVQYIGYFASDGTIFDDTYDNGQPADFKLKVGPPDGVIAGFANGIAGMKANGERTIYVPASQAYGANPPPGIPANADLVFDVLLVSVNQK